MNKNCGKLKKDVTSFAFLSPTPTKRATKLKTCKDMGKIQPSFATRYLIYLYFSFWQGISYAKAFES